MFNLSLIIKANFLSVLLLFAISSQAQNFTESDYKKLETFFIDRCSRCHSGASPAAGLASFPTQTLPLNQKMLAELVDYGYITPNNINDSYLWELIHNSVSDSDALQMPPQNAKEKLNSLSDADIVKKWILAGAPTQVPNEDHRAFISREFTYNLIRKDLQNLINQNIDISEIRYLTLAHRYNRKEFFTDKSFTHSRVELKLMRYAVDKLLNSLSWNDQVHFLDIVPGSDGTLLRIDLKNYHDTQPRVAFAANMLPFKGLNPAVWQEAAERSPYTRNEQTQEFVNFIGTNYPLMRADVFLFEFSVGDNYYESLGLSADGSIESLESLLFQGSTTRGIIARGENFQRAGTTKSIPSQLNNRAIDHFKSRANPEMSFWVSYDFNNSEDEDSIHLRPLGPNGIERGISTRFQFEHDGGEFIYQLPNGLLGYAIINENELLIEKAPIKIVLDPARGEVHNAVSCFDCHSNGLRRFQDELAQSVQTSIDKGIFSGKTKDRAQEIFSKPNQEAFTKAFNDTNSKYIQTIFSFKDHHKLTDTEITEEPISAFFDKFNQESLSIAEIAAELWLSEDQHFNVLNMSQTARKKLLPSLYNPYIKTKRNDFQSIVKDISLEIARQR